MICLTPKPNQSFVYRIQGKEKFLQIKNIFREKGVED